MNRNETIADAPLLYRTIVQKALDGTAAPRSAIKAFCLRCVGYTRADVTGCSAFTCPLHKYRSYQEGVEDTDQPHESAEEGV